MVVDEVEDRTLPVSASDDLLPAFRSRFVNPSALSLVKRQCEGICEYMGDLYGVTDQRYVDMMFTFREMTADDEPHSWQVAAAFLAWARRYPELIGQVEMLPCRCQHGWVEVDEATNLWRPCSRCNAATLQQVYGGAAGGEAPREPVERAGDPTPPWDSYDEKPKF